MQLIQSTFYLLAFFSRRTTVKIDVSGLDQEIYQTKRSEAIGLGGCLVAGSKLGDQISLVDRKGERRDIEVNISFLGSELGVKIELRQLSSGVTPATWLDLQEQSSTANKFRMPFQSELTSMLVEQIIIEGSSFLTPLNESECTCIPMLDAFAQYNISAITGTGLSKTPIT